MAITGRFLADFSDFMTAVQKADVALKGMETGAGDVTKMLNKMTDSFSGRKIVQEASLMAQTFENLASKGIGLTTKELAKMGAVAEEAIAKLKAGGEKIPPGIQKIADAAAKSAASLKEMGNAFSGKKVIDDANAAVKAVADLGGASKLTAKEMQAVNATVSEAIAKYKALGQEAPKAMTDLAKATSTAAAPTSLLGKTMGDLGTQLKATALGFISAQAIIGGVSAAFNALVGFVSGSIEAFAAQEAAIKKLTTALDAQGLAVPGLADQYAELAAKFQTTTVFADELVTEMQALLVQVGDVMPADMDRALTAATDLAAGLGIDLRTATMLVAKAFEGNTGALKKYGVVVDEAAVATEGMTAVLDAIQDKFGGQAQAQAETYAGKIKQIANAFDEVKEAVGGFIVSQPALTVALTQTLDLLRGQTSETKTLTDATDKQADAWYGAETGLGSFVDGLRDGLRILNDMAIGLDHARLAAERLASVKPPKGFGVSTLHLEGITKEMRLEQEAASLLAESLVPLSAEHKKLAVAFDQAGKSSAFIADKLEVSEQAVTRYLQAVKKAPQELKAFEAAQEKAAQAGVKAWKDFDSGIKSVNKTMDAFVSEHLKDLGDRGHRVLLLLSDDAVKFAKAMSQGMAAGQATTEGLGDEFAQLGQKIKPIPPEVKKIQTNLDALAKSLTQLATVSGGAFGTIAKELAMMVTALDTVEKATKGLQSGFADLGEAEDFEAQAAAFTDIAASALTMASAFMQATETGTALQKTLKGMALGAQIGKQFGPLGALFGGLIGGLGGFIRSLNAARNAVKDFAKSFGGFDELRRKLTILGDEGERLWKKFTQASGSPEQAAATANEISKALEQVPKKLNDMVKAAAIAGSGLQASMVPYIESLIRAGQLTTENANLLMGLPAAGVPAFSEVEEAAKALGLPIDAIGESIKQMKFTDAADKIVKHLDILQRAGADMDAVLHGARDQIQKLVTEAQQTGKSLPESMKPFLESMVKSGYLTDVFGEKLDSLDDLHFTKPLEDSIEDLIEAMHDLVDTIKNDVGGALDDIGKKVVKPKIQPEYLPPQGAPSGAAAPPPPPTTPEAAAPPPDVTEGERAIRDRGTTAPVIAGTTIIVEMDGRSIAGAVVPHIPGEVSRFVAT